MSCQSVIYSPSWPTFAAGRLGYIARSFLSVTNPHVLFPDCIVRVLAPAHMEWISASRNSLVAGSGGSLLDTTTLKYHLMRVRWWAREHEPMALCSTVSFGFCHLCAMEKQSSRE